MRMAKCIKCGKVLEVRKINGCTEWFDGDFKCEATKKAQVGYGYLCKSCTDRYKSISSYSMENNEHTGTKKVVEWTHGTELECSLHCLEVSSYLQSMEWLNSHDCTVVCEYKSPIQHGLASLSKTLTTLDKFADAGKFSTENHINGCDTVGTHQNIGMAERYGIVEAITVRKHYHALFKPLSDSMKRDSELNCGCKNIAVFGRDFDSSYAHALEEKSDSEDRYNFINVTKNNCIEFRICKYNAGGNGGKKYIETIKVCRKIFKLALEFAEAVLDAERENAVIDAEKLAEKYGKRIAKVYDKITIA